VHLARDRRTGARRVAELCVLLRGADGLVSAVPAWTWDGRAPQGVRGAGAAALAELLVS
jgi:pilus assembly protein CpaF